jgi:hypothetical protein
LPPVSQIPRKHAHARTKNSKHGKVAPPAETTAKCDPKSLNLQESHPEVGHQRDFFTENAREEMNQRGEAGGTEKTGRHLRATQSRTHRRSRADEGYR